MGVVKDVVNGIPSSFVSQKVFVPVHFYGQLVQHDEGCALLRNEVR